MARPAWVVPRRILDARLVDAAVAAGARLLRHRVRDLRQHTDAVVLDEEISAAVVVGADGAHSAVRRALGRPPGPAALALRGYAPVAPGRRGAQVIEFGIRHQPSYAWSFDRGDGHANVGYGEVLREDRPAPTRAQLFERLEALLPGAAEGGRDWVGHHLPLSTARWRPPAGRVLLAGDAAGLVNPLTGEGIYYAVATGIAAGRAAAEARHDGRPERAGERHARATRRILLPHLRHTALAARFARSARVVEAGLRASAADQRVFDGLVELGLARGRLTPTVAFGLGRALAVPTRPTGRPREPA
jgi:flavin-dependent dehydrogenase